MTTTELTATVRTSLDSALAALRRRQDRAGYWKGEFETSVIGEAAEVMFRHYVGATGPESSACAETILAEQSDTGGWAAFHNGPDDQLLSVFCYVALRLVGHTPDEPILRAAATSIRAGGGVEALNTPTMLAWLALIGLWPWEEIPLIPPEVILLTPRMPGNIYQIGAAARGILVAASLFMAQRPVVPVDFGIEELYTKGGPKARPTGGAAALATRFSHFYARHPIGFLRRRALTKASEWLVRTQERDGSWGGNWPQTANVIVGLGTVGYGSDHPVITAAMAGLEQYAVQRDGLRRLEMWSSVVMDTALGVSAAAIAEHVGGDIRPAADRAVRWLLDNQVTELGDWAVLTKNPIAGGWPYEFANNANPDADDTGFALAALRRLHRPGSDPEIDTACTRASQWLASQQCDDGGWAAFEPLRWKLPGAKALAKIGFLEAPSADVTGHVLEALAGNGEADSRPARRGIAWLRRNQGADGSWPGWWACYHLHGTSAAVTGLTACGVPGSDSTITRACAWITAHQNPDGGWGEDIRALHDPAWIGRGDSTPSQTGWALLALLAAGHARSEPVRRGIEFLLATQRADGDWDEPWHTWVVHHDGLYWRDTMLRLIYPVLSLAQYLAEGGPR